ncbi:hypothetical protein OH807_32815 [Kitasatospora sp. NBC_01560]|uniref:hypothetical protein n=1 Tax=Kitasatospora sp. NBC_01560 TaxID=2975965 RepID=UPI00386D480E
MNATAADQPRNHAPATPDAAPDAALPMPPALPDRLGPLVRADGRWVVGDAAGRAHLTFEREGLVHHVAGRDAYLVEWDRLMELGVAVTVDRFSSSKFGGLFSKGSGITVHGSCVQAMVRHPYDMWSAEFSHHRGFYSAREIVLLQGLLGVVVDRKRADLLGDDAWLTAAVQRVAQHHFAVKWRSADDVTAIVDELLARTS